MPACACETPSARQGSRESNAPSPGGWQTHSSPRPPWRGGTAALRVIRQGAAQLPIRQLDAVLARRCDHHARVVVARLVAQAARSAVNHDGDRVQPETETIRDALVVDLGHVLDLGEVIARPERAQLCPTAFT